jgi:toluene monooxygenase system ferredoxin subunit
MAFEPVLPLDDLWIGEMRAVRVAGRAVLLIRLDQGLRAYPDRCAHLGVELSKGTLEDGVITCSAHHHRYDACTGEGVNPRRACLLPLPVQVRAGTVYVDASGVAHRGSDRRV